MVPRDINLEMFTKVVPRRAVNFSIGAFCTEFRCEQLCDDDTFFWIGVNFWPSFGHLLQFEEVQRTANRLPSNSGSVNREPEAEPVQRFDFEPPNPPSAIAMAGHDGSWRSLRAMAGQDRPWPAMAGQGRPWPTMAGHGRPWPAVAGYCRPWPDARIAFLPGYTRIKSRVAFFARMPG